MYGGTGFPEKKEIIRSGNIPKPGRWTNGVMQSRAEKRKARQKFPWKNGFRLHEKRAGVSMGITTERRKKQ